MIIPAPPAPHELKYGTKLKTVFGDSEVIADFDFETYSPAGFLWETEGQRWIGKGLLDIGAAVYTEHPDAEVLSLAYNLKNGSGVKLWIPGNPPPYDLFEHLANGLLIEAWNVSFEAWVWENICEKKYGFPLLPRGQIRCAMAKARAHCLPGSLANAGLVLKTGIQKDKDGQRLLKKFSAPKNPTKTDPRKRILPAEDPEDAKLLYNYNITDTKVEAEISAVIPDLSEIELKFWQIDQEINRRGIHIDIPSVKNLIKIVDDIFIKYISKLQEITGGEVNSGSEIVKIKKWMMYEYHIHVNDLSEETVTNLLKDKTILPEKVKRVLEIRNLINSAAVKKLYAMLKQVAKNNRVHDLFIYHGARTGRATGSGLQPHNFPNSGPVVYLCSCSRYSSSPEVCFYCGNKINLIEKEWNIAAIEQVLQLAKPKSSEFFEFYFPNALDAISGCLRSLITAAPGNYLICSDYSSIEAVVLAAVAKEQWRIDLFNSHGKIYEATASKICGIPFEDFISYKEKTGEHHPKRKIGKVAELASGYQGAIGAWKRFKAQEYLSDPEINIAVQAWRQANPAIVGLWDGLQTAARNSIYNPNKEFEYNGIKYITKNNILFCILPSGRKIVYHDAKIEYNELRYPQIAFCGWNSNPQNGPVGWIKQTTYGGKLVENVIQAISRDILAYAIIKLTEAGYEIIIHVYDEIIAECAMGFGSLKEFEKIMSEMPEWAKDWPIKAKNGWTGLRYHK